MADMTIDDVTADMNVTGVEKFPASDGGTAKSVTTAQIRDFVLAALAASDAASSVDLSEDGIYVKQGNATKRLTGTALAQAVLGYACGLAGVTGPNGNEVFVIDDSGTKKTITLAQVTAYIAANFNDMFAELGNAGTMADSDLVMVKQGNTVKKGTFANLAAFALGKFAAFVSSQSAVSTVEGTEKIAVVSGGVTKYLTVAQIQAAASSGIAPPTATTVGNVPTWGDSTGSSLGAGLSVSTSIRSQGVADNNTIPTEAAVRAALGDGGVTGPDMTTENMIPQWDATAKKLKDGLLLATSVANPGVDTKVPTERAVRLAIGAAVNGLGAGDVTGPTTTTEDQIPQWDATQKKLKNGLGVATSVGGTGADTNVPTEKAVRSAITSAVSAEATARDTAITSAISTEVASRNAAIATAVSAEATARNAAISTAVSGLGTGDVQKNGTPASGSLAKWTAAGKIEGGPTVTATVGVTGVDTAVPTEKAVRTAIANATLDAIAKSGTPTSGKLAKFASASTVVDGPSVTTSVGTTGADTAVPTEKAVRTAITGAITDALATAAADATSKANAAQTAASSAVAEKISAPVSHTENNIPTWGASNELKAGKAVVTVIANNASHDNVPTEKAVRDALPVEATTSSAGLLSAADKAKLDGIVDNSNVAEIGGALSDGDTVQVKQSDTTPKKSLMSRFWTYISSKISAFKIDDLAQGDDNTDLDANTARHGLCPKLSGSTAQFLRGDGSFATPTGMTPFVGTSGLTDGAQGLVPAPTTEDGNKFLASDGSWKSVAAAAAEDVAEEVMALTRYDTVFIPAAAMCPSASNGATASAVAFTNTKHDCMAFDALYDRACEFDFVFPDDWDKGAIKAKFLWTVNNASASANQNVKWEIGCVSRPDGSAVSIAPSSYTSVMDALSQVNNLQRTGATAALTPDGTSGDGNLVHFIVRRQNTSAPSSPLTVEALLLGVVVQFARTNSMEAWS